MSELDLISRSRGHALRVRDPEFSKERIALVDQFSQWLDQATEGLDEVRSILAATPDPDTGRAYKDLVCARWTCSPDQARWDDVKQLVTAGLADATGLDLIFARFFALRFYQHRNHKKDLPDSELLEAI